MAKPYANLPNNVAPVPVGTSAAAQIQALLSPLLNAQAAQRQQAQASTKSIIDYLRGSATPIGRDYQGGINQQNAFARQYAGFQQAANPDAAIQADLRAIHAPAAQAAQIGGELHNAYGRAAADLYNAGGAIPNTAFASDKAGALAFAHSLPSIEGLQAQQLFAKLLAGQASDRSSAESSLASQMQKQAEANAPDPNVYTDKQGRTVPKGYAYNAKGQLQSLGTVGSGTAAATKKPTVKGLTSLQKARFRGTSAQIAQNAFAGFTDDKGIVHPAIGYQEAIQEAYKEGIPLPIILQQLNRYYKRGERGRPMQSYYERKGRPVKKPKAAVAPAGLAGPIG